MSDVVKGIFAGLLFSFMLVYIIFKGGRSKIDPIKLEKISKDIKTKPLRDVISDINEWLT